MHSKIKLYKYQKEGVKACLNGLEKHPAFLIADEMGLGKTLQAIEVFLNLRKTKQDKCLVIAPALVVRKWAQEIKNYAPKAKVCILDKGSIKIIPSNFDFYLLSYNIACSQGIYSLLLKQRFKTAIIDEVHNLKDFKTIRYKKLTNHSFKKIAKTFVLLSGTPFTNNIGELYSIMKAFFNKVLVKHRVHQRMLFLSMFAGHIKINKWTTVPVGIKNIESLKKMISPIMVRRIKKDVLKELPAMDRARQGIESPNKEVTNLLLKETEICNARMLIDSPDKLEDIEIGDVMLEDLHKIRRVLGKAKMQTIIPEIAKKENVLLLCYYKESLEYLANELKSKGKKVVCISGDIPVYDRIALIDSRDYDYLICTIKSITEGINITNMNEMYFMELDYSLGNLKQVEARMHRIGQVNKVQITYYCYDKGVDSDIYEKLALKNHVFSSVLDESRYAV